MFEPEKFEYKIDSITPPIQTNNELQKYLNDRGLEGWRVVYANNGVIWWMRRKV
jgi:hypothetical protein